MRLVISSFLIIILLLLTGCFTAEKKDKVDKVNKVNTIELEGWGYVTFRDEMYHNGKKIHGFYWKYKGKHHIEIARDADSFERTFLHEGEHAQGYWHHKTEEEKKIFEERMSKYGSLKEVRCRVKNSKRNKKKTIWTPHSASAE